MGGIIMRKFKFKILLSLLLCLLFCSQVLLPVSAEGSDNNIVPDSPYITGLQVKDNDTGEFIIKRSARAPVRSSASSDSSDSVYYFKDIVAFQGTGVTPNPNTQPGLIEMITLNGYRGYKFKQKTDDFYSKHGFFRTNPQSLEKLRSANKYHVTFSMQQSNNWGAYHLYLYDSVDSSRVISLAKKDFSQSIAVNASFDFYVTIPETWTGVPTLRFESTQLSNSEVYYQIFINDLTFTDVTNENLDKSLGTLGDRIKGFFEDLANTIKGFFIPEEGFFDTVKQNFETLLSEHLGFLYQAPSMVTKIIQLFVDWQPSETPYLDFPAVDFDVAGTHVHLWDEVHYTFDFLQNAPFSTLYAFYKTLVFCIVSLAMVNLAIKKYHNIIGGGSDDN